eukprot:6258533-Amphidinium_carterae.1
MNWLNSAAMVSRGHGRGFTDKELRQQQVVPTFVADLRVFVRLCPRCMSYALGCVSKRRQGLECDNNCHTVENM